MIYATVGVTGSGKSTWARSSGMDVLSDDMLWYVHGKGEYHFDSRTSLDFKERAIATARAWPRHIVIDSADWFLSNEDRLCLDLCEVTWMVFPTPPWPVVKQKRIKDARGLPLHVWADVYLQHTQRLQYPAPAINVRYMEEWSNNLG